MLKRVLLMAAVVLCGAGQSFGDVIFSQNFNTSAVVGDYVSTTPTVGQFNSIATSGAGVVASITSDDLTFSRTGNNAGGFTRLALDSNPLTAFQATFVMQGSTTTAQTTAATIWFGKEFTATNSGPANANVHSRLGINFVTGGIQFRDIGAGANTATFSGEQTVNWFVNNSGSSFDYLAPDASTVSISNDTAQLWVGNTRVFSLITATTPTVDINDFKFLVSGGAGTIAFDSIAVNTITAVPEPSSIALVSLMGCTGMVAAYRRRKAKPKVA